jgi:hypothetical protein
LKDLPYSNGTNCIECPDKQFFFIETSKCGNCNNGSYYDLKSLKCVNASTYLNIPL